MKRELLSVFILLAFVVTGTAQTHTGTASTGGGGGGSGDTVDSKTDCICTLEYAPVCGVDGKTYGNACGAACANVEVAYTGECEIVIVDRVFSVGEVWKLQKELLNQVITVKGEAAPSMLACTLAYCPGQCCNSCSGALALTDGHSNPLPLSGQDSHCGGNECEVTCKPLQKGNSYHVTGLLQEARNGYGLALQIQRYELIKVVEPEPPKYSAVNIGETFTAESGSRFEINQNGQRFVVSLVAQDYVQIEPLATGGIEIAYEPLFIRVGSSMQWGGLEYFLEDIILGVVYETTEGATTAASSVAGPYLAVMRVDFPQVEEIKTVKVGEVFELVQGEVAHFLDTRGQPLTSTTVATNSVQSAAGKIYLERLVAPLIACYGPTECDIRPIAKVVASLAGGGGEYQLSMRPGDAKTFGKYQLNFIKASDNSGVFVIKHAPVQPGEIYAELLQPFTLSPKQTAHIIGTRMELSLAEVEHGAQTASFYIRNEPYPVPGPEEPTPTTTSTTSTSSGGGSEAGTAQTVEGIVANILTGQFLLAILEEATTDIADIQTTAPAKPALMPDYILPALPERLRVGESIARNGYTIRLLDVGTNHATFIVSPIKEVPLFVYLNQHFKLREQQSAHVRDADITIRLDDIEQIYYNQVTEEAQAIQEGTAAEKAEALYPFICEDCLPFKRVRITVSDLGQKVPIEPVPLPVEEPAPEEQPVEPLVKSDDLTGSVTRVGEAATKEQAEATVSVGGGGGGGSAVALFTLAEGESASFKHYSIKVEAIYSTHAEFLVTDTQKTLAVKWRFAKGWNLFSIPGELNNPSTTCDTTKFILYEYDPVTKTFSKAGDAVLGTTYWLFNRGIACTAQGTLLSEVSLEDLEPLQGGWNFVSIVSEMDGLTFEDMAQECGLRGAFSYNAIEKKWENVARRAIGLEDLGKGAAIKVGSACRLAFLPPPLPPLPDI